MRTRTATLIAVAGATLAVAAAGSLAAAAAPANAAFITSSTDVVPDHHLDILRFPPRAPSFRPCIARHFKLRSRFWEHSAFIVSTRHRDDPDLQQPARIRIPVRGVYKLDACRGWNRRTRKYEVRSTLRGHGWSHTIKNVFERDPNDFNGPSRVYGNGRYEWGGRLDLPCPGCTHPSRVTR
jgi:hypothetical protein